MAGRLVAEEVNIALFPELAVTGYTCADLFGQDLLLDAALKGLKILMDTTLGHDMIVVVGVPLRIGTALYNCAAVIQGGSLLGIVPKHHIPNYGEFYEKRWFASGGTAPSRLTLPWDGTSVPVGQDLLFEAGDVRFGIEICEDLWVPEPPSGRLAMAGAEIILNLSATNELIGKHRYLLDLVRGQSARCRCAYVYASAGMGESSTDLAFSGNCMVAENGTLLSVSERFTMSPRQVVCDVDVESLRHDRMHFNTFRDCPVQQPVRVVQVSPQSVISGGRHTPLLKYRHVRRHPFLDENPADMSARCEEISSIQAWGLAVRLRAIGCRTAVVGISGGLDSTLALLVTVKAFDMLGIDRKGVVGVTMPGFGTTDRTKDNASRLMELLGVTEMEIPIGEAVRRHFHDIGHDGVTHDVTYENSQARERTMILMDVANMRGGIVIGTGDLSELALGWCTYNGDQMSMYGVNASIPKTLVRYLVRGYADNSADERLKMVLGDIIDTPISPELLPPSDDDTIRQKTEDLVGPYELHDFYLYQMMRYGMGPLKILALAVKAFGGIYTPGEIRHWLKTFYRRFFAQQFKRSCMPDGVKAGSVCLSPRGDWRMPSDASWNLWKSELETIGDNDI